jgi:hypothetical protein
MQVFCNPQVERCFTVPAARRIYATSDQVAVAEINHFHFIAAMRCRSRPQTKGENPAIAGTRHVPIQRTDPASKDTQLTRENRVISCWYGL